MIDNDKLKIAIQIGLLKESNNRFKNSYTREYSKFGGRRKKISQVINKFNKWKAQRFLKRINKAKKKTVSGFGRLTKDTKRNIAWDAFDGVL